MNIEASIETLLPILGNIVLWISIIGAIFVIIMENKKPSKNYFMGCCHLFSAICGPDSLFLLWSGYPQKTNDIETNRPSSKGPHV